MQIKTNHNFKKTITTYICMLLSFNLTKLTRNGPQLEKFMKFKINIFYLENLKNFEIFAIHRCSDM